MGAVAEMLRRRERQKPRTRFSWWELMSMVPVGAAFLLGAYLIGGTGPRWLSALAWACYGALTMVLVLLAVRIARGIFHRATLKAAMPLRYPFFMTVVFGVDALFPDRVWGDQGLAILAQVVVAACIVVLAQWLARELQRPVA